MINIRKPGPGETLPASLIGQIIDNQNIIANMTVGPGLNLSSSAAGIKISLTDTKANNQSSPEDESTGFALELHETWDADTIYRVNERVCYLVDGDDYYNIYKCLDEEAGSTDYPNIADDKWECLTLGIENPLYETTSSYVSGDKVRYGSQYQLSVYTCISSASSGEDPTSKPDKWEKGSDVVYGLTSWPPTGEDGDILVPYSTWKLCNERYNKVTHQLLNYYTVSTYDSNQNLISEEVVNEEITTTAVPGVGATGGSVTSLLLPYTGATSDLDMGSHSITTTGPLTAGVVSAASLSTTGTMSAGAGSLSSLTISGALAVGTNNTLIVNTTAGSGQLGRVGINGDPQAQRFEITHGHIRFNQFAAPSTGCTAALVTTAGNVTTGTHAYFVTFVTAEGETDFSTTSNVVTADASHGQVNLSAIPTGMAGVVTARKIYRSKGPGATNEGYYLATIADNTTTTYTDNISDASLGAGQYFGYIPNTTAGKIYIGTSKYFEINKSCVILGNLAGNAATAGLIRSIAIGSNALLNIISGDYNIAIGTDALKTTTGSSANIGIGYQSDLSVTSGTRNIGLGINTNKDVSTNSCNVSIGGYSGYRVTGENNTALGDYAGYDYTSGSRNIHIGKQAGYNGGSAVTLSDTVNIGYNAVSAAANSVTFGSISAYGFSTVTINSKTSTDLTVNFGATTNSGQFVWKYSSDYFQFNDDVMLNDGENLIAGTTTGSKIGTVGGASGQKLGFWNATPIVQPVLATGASNTVDNVITVLQNLGLCRQS